MQSSVHIASDIPSYKCWSIFNMFCCCLPLGILATIYSFQSESATKRGDIAEAEKSSRMAKKLNLAAVVIGIIIMIIVIALEVTIVKSLLAH
ncbi:interferon-induced transmembrane protein 2-like [Rhinoraja longicauda]